MLDIIEKEQTARYAKCIQASRRVRWDIETDVIRGRSFDTSQKYLPDSLSRISEFATLTDDEKRLVSQIQGRTYAYVFGLVERFINAKILDVGRDHILGDQTALEALIRFSDEELKHQELFRRVEAMIAEKMPAGYELTADPNAVAEAVLSKSTWAVLTLTLHIELFTQAHYRQSIDGDSEVSDLYKDIFLYHWREESQHAIIDELELRREDAKLSPEQRDKAVDDFIALVGAVDGILQEQAEADTDYFIHICGRSVSSTEGAKIGKSFLRAYRWQYILSGAEHPHFQKVLGELITAEQGARIEVALSGFH